MCLSVCAYVCVYVCLYVSVSVFVVPVSICLCVCVPVYSLSLSLLCGDICLYRISLQILGDCNENVILEQTRETVPYFVLIGVVILAATAIQVFTLAVPNTIILHAHI